MILIRAHREGVALLHDLERGIVVGAIRFLLIDGLHSFSARHLDLCNVRTGDLHVTAVVLKCDAGGRAAGGVMAALSARVLV